MRNHAAPLLLCLLVTTMSCGDDTSAPGTDAPAVADVYTPGSVFSPYTADVRVGGTVRFHMSRAPDGDGHNAIFSDAFPGAPDDITVVVDTTVSRIFATRGTFGYVCTVHPGMVGEVVVH